jgi:hypothetical protein
VGFEPTISVLEQAKTVRALDRAGTAIGNSLNLGKITHEDKERLENTGT